MGGIPAGDPWRERLAGQARATEPDPDHNGLRLPGSPAIDDATAPLRGGDFRILAEAIAKSPKSRAEFQGQHPGNA